MVVGQSHPVAYVFHIDLKNPIRFASFMWQKSISVALFIIGILAVSSVLPGSTVGWTVASLALGRFVCQIVQGKVKGFCGFLDQTLTAVILISMGILAGTGTISSLAIGWTLIILPLVMIPCGSYRLGTRLIELENYHRRERA